MHTNNERSVRFNFVSKISNCFAVIIGKIRNIILGISVVSGGQGEGEDITEAEAMADYLTAHGIDSARIVQEDRSRTTRENLENSFAILRARGYDPADGVGIVTSEYHLCRAKRMARALGAEPVGIAAETTLPSMRINYFIREAFAAAYMQLAGTLY